MAFVTTTAVQCDTADCTHVVVANGTIRDARIKAAEQGWWCDPLRGDYCTEHARAIYYALEPSPTEPAEASA